MGFRFFHTVLWLGGLFFGVVPFLWKHDIQAGNNATSWGDHLGSGALVFLALAAMGSFLWGILTKFIKVDVLDLRQLKWWYWVSFGAQSTISLLGILGVITGYSYYFTGGVACVVIAWLVYLSHGISTELWYKIKSFGTWMIEKNHWNGVFYIAIFLLLLWHNFLMVYDIKPFDLAYHSSLLINRFFNQLAIIGTLYLIIQFSIVAAPSWSRFIVWFVSSLIPVAIFADSFLVGMWNTNLVDFLNAFGIERIKNIESELQGGGIPVSLLALIISILGGALALSLCVWGMHALSKKWKMAITPLAMVIIVIVSILGATIEQNIGLSWKQRGQVLKEQNDFDVQLGITSKLKPLAEYDVTFKDHNFILESNPDLPLAKPNVFMILVESFREDALTKEITPFIHKFKTTEAQPIKQSWAASNGTHLSWFSIFSGRLPIHWADDRDLCKEQSWPGLKVFNELKQSGYDLQIYAPGSLSYLTMRDHFFGEKKRVFTAMHENIEEDKEIYNKDQSERERLLLDRFKRDISSRVASKSAGYSGGLFHIYCIDSPHFYYQWHKDFDPPFSPSYQGTYMPSRPSEEQLQSVKNKYFNALAWSDHLVEQFIEHLKKEKIYDESIVVIMGDHGEEFQDNGGWLHVSSLENEQIRVPILVKWPKSYTTEKGSRGPSIDDASHLDVMPSLLEYIYGQKIDSLPGVSLLDDRARSTIATTSQTGQTKEAMMFAKGEYKAYFKWHNSWNSRPTNRIQLSRITGPKGDVEADTPEDFDQLLKELFPDAIDRTFQSFKLRQNPSLLSPP